MRILFLVDGFFPGIGGAELQAQLLAKTLVARGHQVQIVAPHLLTHLPLEEVHEGVPLKRITYAHIPKLANIFYMINFARFVLKHGREYDAVHIHMVHKMASVIALLRPWVGGPVLAKVSGATEFEGGVLDFTHDRFYKRWLRKLLMRIDYYQSLSTYSTEQIRLAGARSSQVITLANALESERYQLSPALHGGAGDDGEFVFAFCGRLVEVKALPVLFQAVANLRAQGFDNFLLRLAGDGDQAEALVALVDQLGLYDYVEFCGRTDDVPGFLGGAHAYVQVSRYEGLSNSVLEAMCTGLAPVLTRISGNEDLVVDGESGYLIEVDDVAALTERMATLLRQREHCRALGLAARERVEELCALDHVVDTLETIYRGDYHAAVDEALAAEAS